MNKYVIDYGYGVAQFYTEATDPAEVRREFYACANACFGIRKSLAGYEVVCSFSSAALPLPYRGFEATHFLSHSGGDDILFDSRFQTLDGSLWKLRDERGDWCSCSQRGTPELACEVHHYFVADHDMQCRCQEKFQRQEKTNAQ